MADNTDKPGTTGESGQNPSPPPPPGARKRGRRLANAQNVKACLGDVVRGLEAGTLESGTARGMTYALAVLLQAIQGADLEARLTSIEEHLQLKKTRR